MSVERATRIIFAGIEKLQFLIVPGFLSKWSYFNKRLNPSLTRFVMDAIVKLAMRQKRSDNG
ncbi:MAG: hypothetical protein C4518_11735 [Desulfobacteraceae bacterium]|nr:MAG: hypothetical protein C4518_11735 [Desulfobacteraceae bacterium]